MSWAAHNPEAYDDITRKGIQRYLEYHMHQYGFTAVLANDECQVMEALVTVLQEEPKLRSVYDALLSLANNEIIEAEQHYFSRLHGG